MRGKLHTGGGKPFGNIASIINPNEEKRNSTRIWRIQCCQAVTDLFKAAPKPAPQKIEIIPKAFRRLQKGRIGHHHRTGEVTGKRDFQQ